MPWAKFDDRFPSNRKVRLLSDGAFRLYVSAICWSAENLTDGVIRTEELRLVADVRASRTRAKELVDHGLWEVISKVGWRIHDYHEYQPTADQVRQQRKQKSARQKRWRDGKSDDPEGHQPGDVDASTDASRDASADAPEDAAPTRPDPYPRSATSVGSGSEGQRETAAPSSLRSEGLPSKAGDDHVPAEDPLPVVRTATIPARARGVAEFDETELGDRFEAAAMGRVSRESIEDLISELGTMKRHHMQGCGYCQQGPRVCHSGGLLLAWWGELSARAPLGAPAPF